MFLYDKTNILEGSGTFEVDFALSHGPASLACLPVRWRSEECLRLRLELCLAAMCQTLQMMEISRPTAYRCLVLTLHTPHQLPANFWQFWNAYIHHFVLCSIILCCMCTFGESVRRGGWMCEEWISEGWCDKTQFVPRWTRDWAGF